MNDLLSIAIQDDEPSRPYSVLCPSIELHMHCLSRRKARFQRKVRWRL